MSSDRYLFDLSLLEKDYDYYGHDPHTHYYLGITHEAYAEKGAAENRITRDEYEYHGRQAVKYLKLRVESQYADEFYEERWSAIYLIAVTYLNIIGDIESAMTWFALCRDFSPPQTECSIALIGIYLSHGLIEKAWEETILMLKADRKDRQMMNYISLLQCEVPSLVKQVFEPYVLLQKKKSMTSKNISNDVSNGHALYYLLMEKMTENPLCENAKNIVSQPRKTPTYLEKVALKQFIERVKYIGISKVSSLEDICITGEYQNFMKKENYFLDPCKDIITNRSNLLDSCEPFDNQYVSISESFGAAKEESNINFYFYGAANIQEIIHFVYVKIF